MSLVIKMAVNLRVIAGKLLLRHRTFKALHRTLSSPKLQVQIFTPVV